MPWARATAYAAGAGAACPTTTVPLDAADGATLAEPLVTLTDLPAFATSSVDGWAVRGPAPWRIVGRVLAGAAAQPLSEDGTCVEIATGAMVPPGAEHVVRVEESTTGREGVTGRPRAQPDWREPGEEARRGEQLLSEGTPITPGVIGLAASCGYDRLTVRPRPAAAVLVFGDELLTSGPPGAGRVRDALGPQIPAWLRRAGADPATRLAPVEDTLDGHIAAIKTALGAGAELICTTGGTMHGPVDHLHPALAALGGRYVINTVAVRPGFPATRSPPWWRSCRWSSRCWPACRAARDPARPWSPRAPRSPGAASTRTLPWCARTRTTASPIRCPTRRRRYCAVWRRRPASRWSHLGPRVRRARGCRSYRCRCNRESSRDRRDQAAHGGAGDHRSAGRRRARGGRGQPGGRCGGVLRRCGARSRPRTGRGRAGVRGAPDRPAGPRRGGCRDRGGPGRVRRGGLAPGGPAGGRRCGVGGRRIDGTEEWVNCP